MVDKRIYIVPEVMSSKLNRRLIKVIASKFDARLSFRELSFRSRRDVSKGYFFLEIPQKNYRNLLSALKKFDIEYTKREEEAIGVFENRIIADALDSIEEGLPIGINTRRDRIVLLPVPSIGVSRERVTPLYLSHLLDSVLWIGQEFRGYNDFLDLVDELKLGGISSGGIYDIARIIARETIGPRYSVDIAEKLMGGEELISDEEFVVSSESERVLDQVRSWGIFNFREVGGVGKHLLDVSGLPSVAVNASVVAGVHLGYQLIVVDNSRFNPKILRSLKNNQSLIWIDKFKSPSWAQFVVDAYRGILTKKKNYMGRTINYTENFIPIWEVIDEVSGE